MIPDRNANELAELLLKLGASPEIHKQYSGKTLAEAHAECQQANHMLWFYMRMVDKPGWPTRKQVILALCKCLEITRPFDISGMTARILPHIEAYCNDRCNLEALYEAISNAATYATATYTGYLTETLPYPAYAADAACMAVRDAACIADAIAAYTPGATEHLAGMADIIRPMLRGRQK